jgi:hypothetical protein
MSRAYRARRWMVGVVLLLAAASFAARLPRLAVVLHGFNINVQVFSTTDPGLSLIRGLRAQGWKWVAASGLGAEVTVQTNRTWRLGSCSGCRAS